MARPKSDDKRNAILAAAVAVFAEGGLGAPTSAVSRAAGIAEGTLFTYFTTKDELINALYREIKLELGDAMMSGFPRKKNIRGKMQHIWENYVNWGVSNPEQCKVLAQLMVSDIVTAESREAGMAAYAEVQTMYDLAIESRVFKDGVPVEFVSKTLVALAQAVMELIALNPKNADRYRKAGFDMFWAGIAQK